MKLGDFCRLSLGLKVDNFDVSVPATFYTVNLAPDQTYYLANDQDISYIGRS